MGEDGEDLDDVAEEGKNLDQAIYPWLSSTSWHCVQVIHLEPDLQEVLRLWSLLQM